MTADELRVIRGNYLRPALADQAGAGLARFTPNHSLLVAEDRAIREPMARHIRSHE